MSDLDKKIEAMAKRYEKEARELNRSLPRLKTGERLCAQTHANCKEAMANELLAILRSCRIKTGAKT